MFHTSAWCHVLWSREKVFSCHRDRPHNYPIYIASFTVGWPQVPKQQSVVSSPLRPQRHTWSRDTSCSVSKTKTTKSSAWIVQVKKEHCCQCFPTFNHHQLPMVYVEVYVYTAGGHPFHPPHLGLRIGLHLQYPKPKAVPESPVRKEDEGSRAWKQRVQSFTGPSYPAGSFRLVPRLILFAERSFNETSWCVASKNKGFIALTMKLLCQKEPAFWYVAMNVGGFLAQDQVLPRGMVQPACGMVTWQPRLFWNWWRPRLFFVGGHR